MIATILVSSVGMLVANANGVNADGTTPVITDNHDPKPELG